jgi:hypothetical protein
MVIVRTIVEIIPRASEDAYFEVHDVSRQDYARRPEEELRRSIGGGIILETDRIVWRGARS